MPVKPNFLERVAFFTTNAAPGVLLDLVGALAYQALSTTVQLNLFPALEEQPGTAAELADRLNVQERGMVALLGALESIGYVERRNGRYANSKLTQKWLLDNEAFDTASLLAYWDAAMRDLWSYAPQVLRTGERPYDFYKWVEADPDLAHSFQQTMVMAANNTGPDIAKKLKLPDGPARLLDVGGGHGMFRVIMCEHYPQLQASILDSHSALQTARQHVDAHNLQERISLQEADIWTAGWGDGYDVILLFNLLHHFDRQTNMQLLQKTATALKPGGAVAILDQIGSKARGSVATALMHLMALQYYLFVDGRVFTHDELSGMLSQVGFSSIQFHEFAAAPGTSLMTAAYQ